MDKKTSQNIKLGIFILLGIVLFIGFIYYLGTRQNLFGSSLKIEAVFNSVSGLQEGNNVRFAGINVGTVENIQIISDSTVQVTMLIDEASSKFIKKDSKVTIESQGLMGNKIIAIRSGSPASSSIEEGDALSTVEPIEIDEVIRTVQRTGQNALAFTDDLTNISEKIKNGEGALGSLVADPVMENKIESIVASFNQAGNEVQEVSKNIAYLSEQMSEGKGTLGELITEDTLMSQLKNIVDSLQLTSHHAIEISQQLNAFSEKLNNRNSALGVLLTDSALAKDMEKTISNVNQAAAEIDVTAEKINNSWLLNGLFGGKRDKEKSKEK